MPFDGNPHPYEPPAGAPFDQVLRDLEVARGKVPSAGYSTASNRETDTAPMGRSFPRHAAMHIAQSPRYASCSARTHLLV